MDKKGLLIVVSGPSGAGKGTVCSEFLRQSPDTVLSVSATTRPARQGEQDGVEYHFISPSEFQKKIERDELLEHVNVFQNYYGTPKRWVQEKIDQGLNVLLEIEIVGAMKVRQKFPEAVLIFVLPPSFTELRKRITGRGTETTSEITERMARAMQEITSLHHYDYFVINDNVNQVVSQMHCIVRSENSRVGRYADLLISKYREEL